MLKWLEFQLLECKLYQSISIYWELTLQNWAVLARKLLKLHVSMCVEINVSFLTLKSYVHSPFWILHSRIAIFLSYYIIWTLFSVQFLLDRDLRVCQLSILTVNENSETEEKAWSKITEQLQMQVGSSLRPTTHLVLTPPAWPSLWSTLSSQWLNSDLQVIESTSLEPERFLVECKELLVVPTPKTLTHGKWLDCKQAWL